MSKLRRREEEEFCQSIVKTKDPAKTVLDLGYHGNISKRQAYLIGKTKIELSGAIAARISEVLDESGLSLRAAVKKHGKLLNARKGIVVDKQLEYIDDNNTQIEALDKLYKLHGLLQNSMPVFDNRKVNVSINNLDKNAMDKLTGIVEEMSNLASKLDLSKNKIVCQPKI